MPALPRPAGVILALGLPLLVWGWAQQATPAGPNPTSSAPASPATGTLGLVSACDENSENSCTELVRKGEDGKERRIVIVRTGTTDDTGIDAVCGPREDEPDTVPTVLVLSESGPRGVEISIDKNLIRVPLAVITKNNDQPTQAAGQESKGGDGRIEASAGTARILDAVPEGKTDRLSLCGVEASPQPAPDTVFVQQGRTELKGQTLVYDESDGVARIEGPISFKRTAEKDPLSGSSQRIEINVDTEKTVLVGNVVLNSAGGRVSKAARVEYDDTKNEARLYPAPGQVAESRKGREFLQVTSGSILYLLDRDEVVIRTENGGISGEFPDGEDDGTTGTPPTTTPSTNPATPTTPNQP